MSYLIKKGRLVDPTHSLDGVFDILISEGRIARIGSDLADKAAHTIDADGKIVTPGFIDMHAHLREPGREDKETIRTGTRAAVRGGFTTVACMPNTEPALDDPEAIKLVKAIAKRDARCNVCVVGAITKGRAGEKIADLKGLKRAGAVAVSDDGACIQREDVMRRALREAKQASLLLIDHCEDTKLAAGGVVNKGFFSTKLGLRGSAAAAEYAMVERDIGLARELRAAIHIAHVSTAGSVAAIRKAKALDIAVTAETAPHYFALTEACCATYDTMTKMNPPLRTAQDVAAIKEGLADGTIDAIATDHAPHTDAEKGVEFDVAPFGIIGLETALSLAIMELVDTQILSWSGLVAKLFVNPARILGIKAGGLAKGAVADITVIDPAASYTYTKGSIESKSKNSPFIGWTLTGRAVHLFVGGRPAMQDGVLVET